MTKIVGHTLVWNCAQFVAASILPIHKYVDEMWFFDGAYKDMKKYVKVPWSTDGTKEIVESLKLDCKKIWVPCKEFFETEKDKWVFAVSHLNDGEWKYDTHDDEIATMDIKAAFQRVRNEKHATIGFVPRLTFPRARELFSPIPEGVICPYEYKIEWQLRALREHGGKAFEVAKFLKQDGINYGGTISDIFDRQGTHWTKWPRIVLDEMFIWHLKWLREQERNIHMLDYEHIDTSLAL